MSRKITEDQGNEVPGWIVSFTDMITLLLAFFVLLQAFAVRQDPELFFIGQGSFKRAIAGWGIPQWLLGRDSRPDATHRPVKYPTKPDPEQQNRRNVPDAEDARIREIFNDLRSNMDSSVEDDRSRLLSVQPTNVHFDRGEATLDADDRRALDEVAARARQTLGESEIALYVIGLAADEQTGRDAWTTSALRAAAAADYLRTALRGETRSGRWKISSWGAGAGDAWCRENGIAPDRTDIAISLVRTDD